MIYFCIGVLSGALLSLFLPIVPPFFAVFLLLPVNFILLKYRKLFFFGVLTYLSLWLVQLSQYEKLQQQLFATDHIFTGHIIGPVKRFAEYSQFQLQLDNSQFDGYVISLSWRLPDIELQPGQYWRLRAALRPVTGLANPGGFNREAQAILSKLLAQGRVTDEIKPALLSSSETLRSKIHSHLMQVTKDLSTAPLLIALAMGERDFEPTMWRGIQDSGLAHLLAISGLHIGLVFGWCLIVVKQLPWPLSQQRFQHHFAVIIALAAAAGYAWLSGFAIPTLRALVALTLFSFASLQGKRFGLAQFWLLLAAMLLLLDPALVLSKSYWLSILAVSMIFFLLWVYPPTPAGLLHKVCFFIRYQFLLTLVMSLISLLMFGGISSLSFISNMLFVPWCTLVAIPLLFVSFAAELLLLPGRHILWQGCDWVFLPLFRWLEWCAQTQSWMSFTDVSPLFAVMIIVTVAVSLLIKSKFALFFLPALVVPVLAVFLKPAYWQLHLIDVGQGLSVLLQFGNKGLLYDAGPRYGEHSATTSQVLPFLRQQGIVDLETIILSHNDSDHSGDWQALQHSYPAAKLYTDINVVNASGNCAAIPERFLSAKVKRLHTGRIYNNTNDNSCVILLDVAGWKILLPGDISKSVEQELLLLYPRLNTDVLVLAHHGSNSSSHLAFLHQLSPVLALNSASLFNRHQHPSKPVILRLGMLGIPFYNTAQAGAITLNISVNAIQLEQYRQQRIPFWQQKPTGNAETSVTTR